MMSWKCLSKCSDSIHSKKPPYAELHVLWCEMTINENIKKITLFSSYWIYFYTILLLFCIILLSIENFIMLFCITIIKTLK